MIHSFQSFVYLFINNTYIIVGFLTTARSLSFETTPTNFSLQGMPAIEQSNNICFFGINFTNRFFYYIHFSLLKNLTLEFIQKSLYFV